MSWERGDILMLRRKVLAPTPPGFTTIYEDKEVSKVSPVNFHYVLNILFLLFFNYIYNDLVGKKLKNTFLKSII